MSSSLKDIYGYLLAGKRINIDFPDEAEAEKFRVRMAQFKRVQERAMTSLGMMEESDRLAFSFSYDSKTGFAALEFKEKKKEKLYNIVIIEDEAGDA